MKLYAPQGGADIRRYGRRNDENFIISKPNRLRRLFTSILANHFGLRVTTEVIFARMIAAITTKRSYCFLATSGEYCSILKLETFSVPWLIWCAHSGRLCPNF